jgi:hypothetical protein
MENKFYENKTVQAVLAATYDKLYYDYRHEWIADYYNDEILFDSNELANRIIIDEAEERGEIPEITEGIRIGIYITDNHDGYSPFKYTVNICYDDENGEGHMIFTNNYLPGYNFHEVINDIRPLLEES